MRYHRKAGIPFPMKQGNGPSSRDKEGNRGSSRFVVGLSVFQWSGDSYVREHLEFPQGCQGLFRGSSGKVGFLSRRHRRKGAHLALKGESTGYSQVAEANLVFLSTYDLDIRKPLMRLLESSVSMRSVRGLSGFLCSRCWGRGPHL